MNLDILVTPDNGQAIHSSPICPSKIIKIKCKSNIQYLSIQRGTQLKVLIVKDSTASEERSRRRTRSSSRTPFPLQRLRRDQELFLFWQPSMADLGYSHW